uniref:Minor capsid protein P11 C-terminal conserved region domain-containing protein n=1 Tax=viral metagenome TaxID=1070528 RepID=A0A6C0LEG9_9ZZZZ
MSISLKKLWSDYGIGAIIVLLILAYGVSLFAKYVTNKGSYGSEMMNSEPNAAYRNKVSNSPNGTGSSVQPSDPLGENEVFASVQGIASPSTGVPTSCSKQNIQNPSDLLPKDNNSQWAQLNPSGKGELSNINLLKAGYHIGIDTIGQTLRNANLQIRSEPPNPQLYVGPWNLSTIEPDFMRPPLELGQGVQ